MESEESSKRPYDRVDDSYWDGGAREGRTVKVIVCGDEPVTRRRMSEAVEASGGSVLAEIDQAFQASEAAERFSADVLLLDLAAGVALGRHPLDDLERPGRTYHLVIICHRPEEIDPDRPKLTVIARHDSRALQQALERLRDPRGEERRRTPPPERHSPAQVRNLSSPDVFFAALNAGVPGDAILLLTLPDHGQLDQLKQFVSDALRAHDHVLRQSSEVIAFLSGSDGVGHDLALSRIRAALANPDELVVRYAVLGDQPPADVFTAEIRALRADAAKAADTQANAT